MVKKFLFFPILTLWLLVNNLHAQDDCTGATAYGTVGSSCGTPLAFDVGGSQTVSTPAATGCGGGSNVDDAWVSFIANSTYTTIQYTNTDRNASLHVYSGSCGSLTQLGCSDGVTVGTETVSITTTIGATYFVRVIRVAGGGAALMDGAVCIFNATAPPTNDNPTSATALTVGSSCSYSTYTTAGATATTCGTIAAPGCANYLGGDVWFSVTVPASGMLTIDTDDMGITDGGMALYTGTACGTMSLVTCDDDNSSNGFMPYISASGLTAGSTVYIRVWEYGNDNSGTFGICVTNPCPSGAPSNDECSGATALTVVGGTSCTSTTAGTISCATASAQANSCFGTDDDDVWYSFVATGTTATVNLSGIAGSVTDMYHVVYSGTCGSLTSLTCSDADVSTTSGLTVGQTYYIRVYTYSSTGGQTVTFNICVNNPCPGGAPTNDECSSATALTVVAGTSCTTTTAGTINCATASAQANSCFGTDDDDVWYSFVATGTSATVNLTSVTGSVTDMYHVVYSGTCGSLTSLTCSDADVSTTSGLTVGQTYYIRVYTYTSTSGQTVTFNICVNNPCPGGAPVNDECSSATGLTVVAGTSCTSTTAGTISCATASAQANSCFGTDDDDVWYSFVATGSNATVNLTNITGSVTDMYFVVYSGTCGSLTSILCSDPNTGTVTGLTAGQTYYIRVYTYTSTASQTVTFDICVNNPCPTGTASNDECTGATALTMNSGSSTCTSYASGSVLCSTASPQANSCTGTDDDDLWYSFVATGTTASVTLFNVAGSTTDLYHVIYSGTCGSLTSLLCSDPNTSSVTGLTIGQTYYIRVYTYTATTAQTTSFDICVSNPCPTGAPANDECTAAVSLTPSSTGCSSAAGTISCATASAQANSCTGTDDDDVWYSFVATSTSHSISIFNVSGSTTDLFHAVYSGTCGSLTSVSCSDPNTSTLTGLTVGLTYYIRVYSYTATTNQFVDFEICVQTNGPCGNPATNDYCSNPAVLTYNPSTDFSSSTASTFTSDTPANTSSEFCGSVENNSWYQFVASNTTHVFNFSSVTGCTSGIQAEVYSVTEDGSGCCTNLSSVSNCWNPATATSGTVTATPLTVGQTYVLMIDGYGGANCNYTVDDWAASGILPVQLVGFNGAKINQSNHLFWTTSSEINNHYFILERSSDGIVFESIARLDGHGTSNVSNNYAFVDSKNVNQTLYYRLKQYNYDGVVTRSGWVVIEAEETYDVSVYPNPATHELNFTMVVDHDSPCEIRFIDLSGKIHTEPITVTAGSTTFKSAIFENLASGLYFIQVIEKMNNTVLLQGYKLVKLED